MFKRTLVAFLLLTSPIAAQQGGGAAPIPAPAVPTAAVAAPGLQFETLAKDYGSIVEGDSIVIAFPFKNTTNKTINIRNISVSCGCTSLEDNPKEVPPGGTAEIRVKYNSTGRAGLQTKTVTVATDDVGQPFYTLSFTGRARTELGLSHQNVFFGEVRRANENVREVMVYNTLQPPVEITKIEVSDPTILVTKLDPQPYSSPDGTSGIQVPVRVTLPKGVKEGRLNGSIILHTTHPTKKTLTIPVMASVIGKVSAVPRSLHFGEVNPGAELERQVLLTNAEGTEFSVTEAKLLSPGPFEVSTEAGSSPGEKLIVVRLKVPAEGEAPAASPAAATDGGRGASANPAANRRDRQTLNTRLQITTLVDGEPSVTEVVLSAFVDRGKSKDQARSSNPAEMKAPVSAGN